MTDEIWSWTLKLGAPLASAGLLWLTAAWVKREGDKTLLQKVLGQIAALMQGLASDITSGIAPAINAAVADGKVTTQERQQLVVQLVALVKTSATGRLLSQVERLLGLSSTSALDTWLRGMAGEHVDAQLASSLPVVAPGAAKPSAALVAASEKPTPLDTPAVRP